jgi:hypothetical protein
MNPFNCLPQSGMIVPSVFISSAFETNAATTFLVLFLLSWVRD